MQKRLPSRKALFIESPAAPRLLLAGAVFLPFIGSASDGRLGACAAIARSLPIAMSSPAKNGRPVARRPRAATQPTPRTNDALTPERAQADALHELGRIATQQGRLGEALEWFEQAVRSRPGFAEYEFSLGLALRALGRTAEAAVAFASAAKLEPTRAAAHHQLGNTLKSLGRYAEALPFLREAVRLEPKNADARLNLGVALLELRQLDEAVACFRRAIHLQPERVEAHNILGHALSCQTRLCEAEKSFREALRLRPDYAPAHDNLGRLLKAQGRVGEAVESFRAALSRQARPATHSNLLLALNYLPDQPPASVLAGHRFWNACHAQAIPQLPPRIEATPRAHRRLRVGYVSPDFAHHAVAYFFEPVLAAHDRENFEVFCYSNVRVPDQTTMRLRALGEHWRDIAPMTDEHAAQLIRADEIDILIDLAGHTANNRLLVFARRPAPVQVSWLGYPNTTGLVAIDWRLTDAIADPPGTTESFHTERLLRLAGPFSCYQPSAHAPAVNPLPALEQRSVTFGCFNNLAKLTPPMLALWSALLHSLPAARLLLKCRTLKDAATAERLRAAFAAQGIAPGRLDFNGDELPVEKHLALYHQVDLALDTHPYNGATTTCEALWMGVPVITLAGQTHVARVGATLLTHVGMPELVASTPDDYLHLARTLAGDLPRLAAIRASLRERMRSSPLCDGRQFTRTLEAAYHTAWSQHVAADRETISPSA